MLFCLLSIDCQNRAWGAVQHTTVPLTLPRFVRAAVVLLLLLLFRLASKPQVVLTIVSATHWARTAAVAIRLNEVPRTNMRTETHAQTRPQLGGG